MGFYRHTILFLCPDCDACWDSEADASFEQFMDLTGMVIDGPTKCIGCGKTDVKVTLVSQEEDGSGMDDYTAAMERKADQESGR